MHIALLHRHPSTAEIGVLFSDAIHHLQVTIYKGFLSPAFTFFVKAFSSYQKEKREFKGIEEKKFQKVSVLITKIILRGQTFHIEL